MKINRFLPLITSLLTLIAFEIFFIYPKLIYLILVIINLLFCFTFRQFAKSSQIDNQWWNYLILPGAMSTLVVIFTALIDNKAVIQLLFLSDVFLLYFFLRYVYYYLIKPAGYEPFSIENISSYGNFLTFFMLATVIYGLLSFLNISIWLLELFLAAGSALITYQIIWANKIAISKGAPYIFIGCLILLEISWAISFLPFNHNVAGLSLAVSYYMLIGLIKNYLLDKLDRKKVKIYLGFGLTSLFLIMLTARWL